MWGDICTVEEEANMLNKSGFIKNGMSSELSSGVELKRQPKNLFACLCFKCLPTSSDFCLTQLASRLPIVELANLSA